VIATEDEVVAVAAEPASTICNEPDEDEDEDEDETPSAASAEAKQAIESSIDPSRRRTRPS
jgi:hypothetical protein